MNESSRDRNRTNGAFPKMAAKFSFSFSLWVLYAIFANLSQPQSQELYRTEAQLHSAHSAGILRAFAQQAKTVYGQGKS